MSVSQSPPVLLLFILLTGTWKMLKSFPSCPSFIMVESYRTRFGFSQLGGKVICLGRDRLFWTRGSLDAGVAAGSDVRSDLCAVLSLQHIPPAEYLPMEPGMKSLGALLVRKGWWIQVWAACWWGREPWEHPGCWDSVMGACGHQNVLSQATHIIWDGCLSVPGEVSAAGLCLLWMLR